MKNALAIARWEFSGTLGNRQFLIFTLVIPIIILGFTLVYLFVSGPGGSGGGPTGSTQELRQQLEQLSGQDAQQAISTLVASSLAFIFTLVVIFSGTFVLQSIVREKQSRVVELLLAAVSPREMITGKILAFGALGLMQALIWIVVGLGAIVLVGPYFGLPVWPFLGLLVAYLPWAKVALFALYFALGYLFIASFSAGMGATMTDVLSGQQLQSLLIALPSMLPLMIVGVVITDPNGFISELFSFIPPTIPGTMMLRVAIAPIPLWQIGASLAVLAAAMLVVMRLAGKVFEVGILMYGKQATLREIWRWTRR